RDGRLRGECLRLAIEGVRHLVIQVYAQLIVGSRNIVQTPAPHISQQMHSLDALVLSRRHPPLSDLALDTETPHVIRWRVVVADSSAGLIKIPRAAIGRVPVILIRRDRRNPSQIAPARQIREGPQTVVTPQLTDPVLP